MHDDNDNAPHWSQSRYLAVKSRASNQSGEGSTPLGDPTKWGTELRTPITAGAHAIVKSAPIIRVQCQDLYARAWQMVGTLEVSKSLWATPLGWDSTLEITQGAGQSVCVQRVSLRALTAYTLASGIYVAIADGPRESRPWVMSGGIFACAVSVRVINSLITEGPAFDEVFVNTINIAPLAAGTWL